MAKEMKLSEWGFRSPLYTYGLAWPGEPPEDGEINEINCPPDTGFEAEHATSRSQRLPTILNLHQ